MEGTLGGHWSSAPCRVPVGSPARPACAPLRASHHHVMALHLRLLVRQLVVLHFETAKAGGATQASACRAFCGARPKGLGEPLLGHPAGTPLSRGVRGLGAPPWEAVVEQLETSHGPAGRFVPGAGGGRGGAAAAPVAPSRRREPTASPQATLPHPHPEAALGAGPCGQAGVKATDALARKGKQKAEASPPPGSAALRPRGGWWQELLPATPPRQPPGPPPPFLPVILSLQELEFVFDPVTRLSHREFKSRLPGLVGSLEPWRTRWEERGHQTGMPKTLAPPHPSQPP